MNQELVYLLPDWRKLLMPQFIGYAKAYPALDKEIKLYMRVEMLSIGMKVENSHIRVAVIEALRSYIDE